MLFPFLNIIQTIHNLVYIKLYVELLEVYFYIANSVDNEFFIYFIENLYFENPIIRTNNHASRYLKFVDYFYHGDHLGSTSLTTTASGKVYEKTLYYPYGETWIEDGHAEEHDLLGYKFTGKELDEETGYYYFGARYYDPQISSWISTDPALGDVINDSKQHSRLTRKTALYTYSMLNPLKFVDPDGKDEWAAKYMSVQDVAQAQRNGNANFFVPTFDASGNITGQFNFAQGANDGQDGSVVTTGTNQGLMYETPQGGIGRILRTDVFEGLSDNGRNGNPTRLMQLKGLGNRIGAGIIDVANTVFRFNVNGGGNRQTATEEIRNGSAGYRTNTGRTEDVNASNNPPNVLIMRQRPDNDARGATDPANAHQNQTPNSLVGENINSFPFVVP